jgi:Fe-coproporphyrin III synthase
MVKIIDIQITSKCNRKCSYCYALKAEDTEINIEKFTNLVDGMVENGISNICISGGEPFLHDKIYEILKYCKNKFLKVAVSTNGDNYEMIHKCIDFIDVIGLPIESYDEAAHDAIRGEGSFKNIIKIIEFISNMNKNIAVRVGTVHLNENENDMFQLYDLVNKYSAIKKWKIYEEIKYDYKRTSQTGFIEVAKRFSLREFLKDMQMVNPIISNRECRNQGYFIIEPNGKVFIPNLRGDIDIKQYIGDIYIDSLEDIINRWDKCSNNKNHQKMLESIFG